MITTRELTKSYGHHVAVDAVTMNVESGEFVVVLGPSGCGKSTLLRMIAGLEDPTRGDVFIDGVRVTEEPARDRGVAMVFQDFALYPHLTARENLELPLRMSGCSRADIDENIKRVAGYLGLTGLLDRRPNQLSGGQRQRVAVARAIVRNPRAFLLDEPLSQIDTPLREALRAELARISRQLRVTTIYVTHDQGEALSLGDRIAVMEAGRVRQIGTPIEVRSDPDDVFVAGFVGGPRTTLVQGAILTDRWGAPILDLGEQVIDAPPRIAGHLTERVTVALRTDALRPVPVETDGCVLRGTVSHVEDLGAELLVHLSTGLVGVPAAHAKHPHGHSADDVEDPFGELVVRVPHGLRPALGSAFAVEVDPARVLLFDRTGARVRPAH